MAFITKSTAIKIKKDAKPLSKPLLLILSLFEKNIPTVVPMQNKRP